MTYEEYIEFHLKTVWDTLKELNIDILFNIFHKGKLYEQIPSYQQNEIDNFKKLTEFEDFSKLLYDGKNHSYAIDLLKRDLPSTTQDSFITKYLNKVLIDSPEDYSKFFLDHHLHYINWGIKTKHLKDLLPKMSYENSLHYFSAVNTWLQIDEIIKEVMPIIKELSYGKDLMHMALKNCLAHNPEETKGRIYYHSCVITGLIKNYSDSELKTFDFMHDINSYLESKKKPANVVVDNDDVFTLKMSVDCQHAKNLFPIPNNSVESYVFLIDKLAEYLNKQSEPLNGHHLLNTNVIHKYEKDDKGNDGLYKISDIYIDTKEYSPNLKPYLTTLINHYYEDAVKAVNSTDENIDFEEFTSKWLLQETLQSELVTNNATKKKNKI